jgi:hypothetical protein
MKFSKILLIMAIITLIASVSFVAAEEATVGPYSFTVPDNYTIAEQKDNFISMKIDENNALSFSTDVDDDIEKSKQAFIDQGQKLITEAEMDYDDLHIYLQAFEIEKDGQTLYTYNFIYLSKDGNFVVTYVTNDTDFDYDLESEDNPVGNFLSSLNLK